MPAIVVQSQDVHFTLQPGLADIVLGSTVSPTKRQLERQQYVRMEQ